MAGATTPVMKVLLSAYACAPGAGSESEVGLRVLMTAARNHEVWLLTRANNVPALKEHITSSGLEDRVHLESLDIAGRAMERKRRGLISLHRYYDLWQRGARDRGLDLHSRVEFDVVHHVTFASYWTRTGVASVPAPLVWGPVGGAVRAPWGLFPVLGPSGMMEDLVRNIGRELAATALGSRKTASGAAVLLVQNADAGRRLETTGAIPRIIPHATSVDVRPFGGVRTSEVVFIGRLIPWKAGILAVRAFRYVTHPEAKLVVFGDGPERERMERSARAWNIRDRIKFEGRIPRAELMRRLSVAGALLHPALHDESPLTVGEALTLGTPVVCLDNGGPPTLAAHWPSSQATAIAPSTPDKTARRLASAVDAYLAEPPEVPSTPRLPTVDFEAELLKAYSLARKEKGGS